MKKKLFFLVFVLFHFSFSQWSTKPYADSGLYVCQGFDPGIVTYNDGSSVVLGLLSSYIYAQKLDPAGYKLWPQPVLVFHNDSSNMSDYTLPINTSWFCSDGDGGVILFWQDYRGTYYDTVGMTISAMNNTTHIQRVDKNGNIKWGADGITISNLAEGFSTARITSDGDSGCVVLFTQAGFGYPGAPNINYLKIARYNTDGRQLWYTVLDSSFATIDEFALYSILRGGEYYYFNFVGHSANYQMHIYQTGDLTTYKSQPLSAVVMSKDENVFFMDYTNAPNFYKLSKTDNKLDTLWTRMIDVSNFNPGFGGGVLIPNNNGGMHLVHICNDSIIYFNSLGSFIYQEFKGIVPKGTLFFGGTYYSDGNGGIIAADLNSAKRFNNLGKMIWPDSVTFLIDPLNAYTPYYIPDNNGGLIIVYWSTLGGIYAQHTGRHGKLGIVTGIPNPINNIPASVELYQNYPNPFNPSTMIKYQLARNSTVTLKVYDVLGREVATLVNEQQIAGSHRIEFDASKFASGVYFYRLIANGKIYSTHKMLLTK